MNKLSLKRSLRISFLSFVFLLFTTISCSNSSSVVHFRGFAMKMPYDIAVVGPLTRHQKVVIKRIIDNSFSETNQVSNHWNSHSELFFFNDSKATTPKKLSSSLRELLVLADQIVKLSEGRYDPTLGPIIDTWKQALSQHHEPSSKTLMTLERCIGWDHLKYTDNTICKDIPDLRLDLDAIAKGKCVDNITTSLVEAGFHNVFVEWSGEIRAHGKNDKSEPWQIEIYSPKQGPNNVILLENQAIATSGNYMQAWGVRSEVDGNVHIFSHLLNKETMRPMELDKKSILSVSVRAPTCAIADGLATAAMLIETPEELVEWTNHIKDQIHGVTFWIVEKQVL